MTALTLLAYGLSSLLQTHTVPEIAPLRLHGTTSGVLGARGLWLRSRCFVCFRRSLGGRGADSSYLNQAALKGGKPNLKDRVLLFLFHVARGGWDSKDSPKAFTFL